MQGAKPSIDDTELRANLSETANEAAKTGCGGAGSENVGADGLTE